MEEIEALRAESEALKLILAVLIEDLPKSEQEQLSRHVEAVRKAYVDGRLLWSKMTDEQLHHIGVSIRAVVPTPPAQKSPWP